MIGIFFYVDHLHISQSILNFIRSSVWISKQPLYMRSVGAWPLGGWRSAIGSWGTPEEEKVISIPQNSTYVEPYRASCSMPNGAAEYCPSADKLGGQGVAIKISASQNFSMGDRKRERRSASAEIAAERHSRSLQLRPLHLQEGCHVEGQGGLAASA